MLYPNPISLFGALLLCLPLAVFFTITTTVITGGDAKQNPVLMFETTVRKARIPKTLITPPPPPPPEDDESLLELAAKAIALHSPPAKVAFMFLTTTPLHFAPLWELYFNQSGSPRQQSLFNIYVHADPTFKYDPPFAGAFAGRLIRAKPSERLTPTLISAARRLLAHALLHDRSNSMFALLSPSCIPLHSFNFTYGILTRSRKSFIEILKNEAGAYDRWAARGIDAMLPEVAFEDFRIGSQFWVLTRKHARLVVGDRVIWPKFNQTCMIKHACYPEENYFATLLDMRDPGGSVSATLTHVDWRGSIGGHPRLYKASEVGPELIAALRSGRPRYGDEEGNGSDASVTHRRHRHHPFLFARKFSPDSIQPLLGRSATGKVRFRTATADLIKEGGNVIHYVIGSCNFWRQERCLAGGRHLDRSTSWIAFSSASF